tara:strand:- start:15849 stop:16892 length:1044 start_codon:yes stop_codon:yes gene_type:complete
MAIKTKRNRLLVFLNDKNKKNYFKIFKEFVILMFLKKEIPFYYFKYIYRKHVINYKDFVSTKEANRIKYRNTFHKEEHLSIISNKLSFSLYCERSNLPTPKLISHNFGKHFYFNGTTYLITSETDLVNFFELVFTHIEKDSIFVKPISLYGGIGCNVISRDSIQGDISKCAAFIIKNSCIHEEFIVQHPEIDKIHPGCINTIRMETFIDKTGEIHILSALMRFGVGDSIVDNAHSGGFYVGIDLVNGSLKNIGHQYMEYGGAELTQHPDNGFIFDGFKVPDFDEVCSIVVKAVQFLPDRYIGWDIAISNNGPIIIEANEYPSIFITDIAYGGYLNHPLYKEIIEEVS